MAQQIQLVDDISGAPADRTIRIGYEGRWFELDLTNDNVAAIEETLRPWLEKGRKATTETKPAQPKAKRPRGARSDTAKIREWAVGAGYEVPERGSLRREIVDAWHQANGAGPV